jgi:hypothetical protein
MRSLVALVGAVVLARKHPKLALLWMLWLLPLLFVLMRQPLLAIRNYLQIAPLMAVAFGFGVVAISDRLAKHGRWRWALAGVVTLVFVFNAGSLAHAAWTVRTATAESMLEDTAEYLREQDYDVYMSPRLHRAIGAELADVYECSPPSGTAPPLREPRVAMYYFDHSWRLWLSNRVDFVEHTAAPRVVNYNYYACWLGRDEELRTVVMPVDHATEMRVPVRSFYVCRRR